MTSITKQVWEILDNDITIKKDLERGFINVSALSQYLLDTYQIKGSLDSIISAIRRYKVDTQIQDDYARISKAMREAVVSTKTCISCMTLKNSATTYKYISQLLSHEDFFKNDVFRLIKTRTGVQIVVDRDSMVKAKSFFPPTTIEDMRNGLVEVSLRLTEEGWATKGVISRIANELATQDINIELLFTVYPVISIFLAESDLVKAHEALIRISGHER